MDRITSLQTLPQHDPQSQPRRASDENEEMAKIFEDSKDRENFNINDLTGTGAELTGTTSTIFARGSEEPELVQLREGEDPRYRDSESTHRSESFPHVHHPLKPQHHRVRRKSHRQSVDDLPPPYTELPEEDEKTTDSSPAKDSKAKASFHVGDEELPEDWGTGRGVQKPEKKSSSIFSSPKKISKITLAKEEEMEDEPLLGEEDRPKGIIRPAETGEKIPYIDDSARKKSRVQFDIGEDEDNEDKARPRRRRSHKRRDDTAEDPILRRNVGSERELRTSRSAAITEEEAQNLDEHALDEISSHRFDDPSGYQRPKVRARSSVASIIHMKDEKEEKKKSRQMPIMKKSYDHSPHEVFVELDELKYIEGNLEWKETARWIKYEEDVEETDNRWGKAHIAFLNFHSLFSLRKGLDSGTILLDLEEKDLPSIASRVVDKMVECDQIPPDQKEAVVRILLLRHRHMYESQSSFKLPSRGSKSTLASSEGDLTKSASMDPAGFRSGSRKAGLSNLFNVNTFSNFRGQNSTDDVENAINLNGNLKDEKKKDNFSTKINIDGDIKKEKGSVVDIRKACNNEILKKIPEGAEATAVLVGAVDFLKQPTIAFVRLAEGVMMDNLVEVPIPVRFLFVLLGPFHGEMDYHEVGRSISTLMSDKCFHEVAYRAHSRGQLLTAINEFLNASIVLPPADWNNKDLVAVDDIRAKAKQMMNKKESVRQQRQQAKKPPLGDGDDDGKPPARDPLKRHGKLFYGMIQDLKIRFPKYLSDIKDGLNGQTMAAAIFIYFAALSAAITFGGMYNDETKTLIGVGETLLISMVNGLIFALFAAQPLLIVGATGPLMIFDVGLYAFCASMNIDFLSIRIWIGVWMTVTALLIAAFEAVAIVKTFTRFTEEIFSTLVCLIFIVESFKKLGEIFKNHPLVREYAGSTSESGTNETILDSMLNVTVTTMEPMIDEAMLNKTMINKTMSMTTMAPVPDPAQPNTALMSMILMLGTFIIAYRLKFFRNSKYLGRSVRRALGDFGVPISIVLMVTLDYMIKDTFTDKLTMPDGLQPSAPEKRGWLINPFGELDDLPVWCIFAAAPASFLLFCLIFLEENICHLILSKPEKNMKKGSGFHWDIVVSCAINIVSGIFGAPFMGPACVRTVSHTSALTVMGSNHAPGESPKIVGVLEQRVSPFIVSLFVGLSVFLTPVLNLIPKAVLFGIFLYMGVASTAGIQFLERLLLVLMPVKHHPNVPYVKKVRTWKMHAFTGVQLILLIVLWTVKASPAALCFPFVLMLLIPIRLYLLPYAFNGTELNALDGKEASATVDESDEPDFFEETHHLGTHIDHPHES